MATEIPEEIQRSLDRMVTAWNAADAHAFATSFAGDATFVIWRGDVLEGRDQIEHAHTELFSRSPGGMAVEVTNFQQLTADVAVLLTRGGTGHPPIVLDKIQTIVLTRHDREWKVAAFHNTNVTAPR